MKKNLIRVLLILFCIFLLYSGISYAFTFTNNTKTIEKLANSILDHDYPIRIIDNPKITINKSNIHINFEIIDGFEDIDEFKQFTSYEYFSKKLRYQLFTKKNALFSYDLFISANSKNNSYEYTNKLPNKQLVFKTRSQLYVNNEIIYTSNEFKKQFNEIVSLFTQEKVNGYNDFEIFMYGLDFFNTMTHRGRYYNPETDNELVVKAVMEKFGITRKEYGEIYEKYYLLY